MFKFYPCILAMWLCMHCAAFAQTPTISLNYYDFGSACLHSTFRLGINTTGTFDANNKFSVQIRKTESSTVLQELPATLKEGKLEFVLNDSLAYGNASIQLRAVASSPKTQSEWSYGISVLTKGTVTLNPGNIRDTINKFDIVPITFSGIGLGNITVTLNDSSRFGFYGNAGSYSSQQTLVVPGTYPVYTIAHAENNCGPMRTSGSYRPAINPTAIKAVSASPLQICENSEVKVTFSTLGNAFSAQTRYRIRFREVDPAGAARLVEVPAALQEGMLVAKFPDRFKLSSSVQFSVQVITDNPSTVSSATPVALHVFPKTGATFSTPSQTMDITSSIYLGVKTYGVPPFTVELTDGSKASSAYGDVSFEVSPTSDKNYSIKTVTSGCGVQQVNDPEVVQVKVRPGIRFAGKQTICAAPVMRVKFVSSVALTDATQFRIGISSGSKPHYYVNATRSGDYLEFSLPPTDGSFYYAQYQIITTNPSLQSQFTSDVVIQSMPSIRYSTYSGSTTFTVPTRLTIGYNLEGGGPYTLEDSDGTIRTAEWSNLESKQFFLQQTTEFKVKSIANGCFKNSNPPGVTLKYQPSTEPAIYIEPLKNGVCNNDSLELTFGALGQFGAGNKFSIQMNAPCCDFKALRVVEQAGKYKVKVAIAQYYPYEIEFRITSSNPVLFSNVERIRLHTPLTDVSVAPQGRPDDPQRYIINATPAQLYVGSSSQIQAVTYSDNGVDKNAVFDQSVNSVYVYPKPKQVSTYVIKTASNECGTFPVDKTIYYRGIPALLQIISPVSQMYCPGTPLHVFFNVVEGKESDDPTYSLEIAAANSFDFTPLVTGQKDKRITTRIPDGLTTGYYKIRVVSSDGSMSEPQSIQISAMPTATLTSENGQTSSVKVDAGQGVTLRVTSGGATPINVVYSNNTRDQLYSGEQSWYVYPTKSQQYSILSVSNACGYGTTNGKVDVSVNPKLTASTSSWSVCEGGSILVNYELMGDIDLADGYIRFSILDQTTNTTIRLDSTRTLKGEIMLRLPSSLPGSYYTIVCSVPKYNLNSNLGVSVTTKPNVTISGNTTINSGESTQLVIRSNKYNTDSPSYVLSDGTKGNIYTGVGALNYVKVSPTKTTTYTIASISNACGGGTASGSAIVEVNPPSERGVTITSLISRSGYSMCTGDTVVIEYKTAGNFSAGNVFTAQISDTTGRNFRNIPTIAGSKLQAVLPTDLTTNAQYRIRLTASDPNTASGAYATPFIALQKAKARFASESVIFDGVNNPKITVLLEGGGPWYYRFGTDTNIMSRQSVNPTDVVELFQASPSQYYRLFSVSNGCGNGTIGTPATVKVEVVTATEPNAPGFQVIVGPNPVQDMLTVKSENGSLKTMHMISMNGTIVRKLSSRLQEERLDIRDLPAGIYLLHIESKGRKATFKVIKQ